MNTKLFEIRDRGTFIPVMVTKLDSNAYTPEENYLLRRVGFTPGTPIVAVMKLTDGECRNDPNDWNGSRTMMFAHAHIEVNFDALQHGQVIDVEFILEEVTEPKLSERLGG